MRTRWRPDSTCRLTGRRSTHAAACRTRKTPAPASRLSRTGAPRCRTRSDADREPTSLANRSLMVELRDQGSSKIREILPLVQAQPAEYVAAPDLRAKTRMAIDDLWYKNAIIYCLDVEKYQDADGDGIGDFEGLMRRLDYLQRLGVTCVWLQPFYPSPNRDNGYDVTDYYGVHAKHGSLGDFVEFMNRAD